MTLVAPDDLPGELEAVQRPRLPRCHRRRGAAALFPRRRPVAGHHEPLADLQATDAGGEWALC